jgi:hypothetical protein
MRDRKEIIDHLKERIGAVTWGQDDSITAYALGISEIDRALKHGGIVAGSCHEIICAHQGPSLGFALYLLASLVQKKGPVLWCSPKQDFYTPGFITFGLKDTDIIFAKTDDYQQSLWAMEQGLMCQELSAVVLDAKKISLAQGRRLKLIAQKYGTTAILLIKPEQKVVLPTIATTRWVIKSEPSLGRPSRHAVKSVGSIRLSINLMRNVGGLAPLAWMVEFNENTLRFHTISQLLLSTNQNRHHETAIYSRQRTT